MIIGLIAGGGALFIIIVGLIVFCIVRRRRALKKLEGDNFSYDFKSNGNSDATTLLDNQKFKHNYPVGINTGRDSVELH